MLAVTLILLICQHVSLTWSTRLPLEVYELTPATVIAHQAAVAAAAAATASALGTSTATATAKAAAAATATASNLVSTSTPISTSTAKTKTLEINPQENSHLANKNLEYSQVNRKNFQENTLENAKNSAKESKLASLVTTVVKDGTSTLATPISSPDNQLDRRRSRQMLDEILEHHLSLNIDLQKQQHQYDQINRKLINHNNNNNINKNVINNNNNMNNNIDNNINVNKDVRILYQVGDSENDLPVCAPNAVCSKIDLYETPWIERQCRCPPSSPNIIIHHHQHHHHDSNNINENNESNKIEKNINSNSHNKYHNYFDKGKHLMHNKHLFMGDYNDKKFESLHLKKLMQKLGAVYSEDLHLQPNEIMDHGYHINDAVPPPMDDIDFEMLENELPTHKKHTASRSRNSYTTVNEANEIINDPENTFSYGSNGAHMRHSGHLNHRPISFIGGCPSSLGIEDGHTIADKTRHYKLCQPVHKLPVCRHFRDFTWTLTTSPELNVTEQIVHCRCPKNSVTYLTKREPAADSSNGFNYLFACSPLTRIRCQRKQPCKLFTVRKRQEFIDEVNINALCQCPKGHHCPSHHTQSGVIAGDSFLEDNIQTFSGYCMAND